MTEFVKCKALVACTEFVAGYGMVHMNPDDPDHAVVDIPAQAVARLVLDERIEVLDNPLDHDHDGRSGGSVSQTGDDIAALRAEYKARVGRSPHHTWDAAKLREKIDATPAKEAVEDKLLEPVEGHAAFVLVTIDDDMFIVNAPWLDSPEPFASAEEAEARQAEVREAGPPEGWEPGDDIAAAGDAAP